MVLLLVQTQTFVRNLCSYNWSQQIKKYYMNGYNVKISSLLIKLAQLKQKLLKKKKTKTGSELNTTWQIKLYFLELIFNKIINIRLLMFYITAEGPASLPKQKHVCELGLIYPQVATNITQAKTPKFKKTESAKKNLMDIR